MVGMRPPEFYDDPALAYLKNQPLPKVGKTPKQIWKDLAVHLRRYDDKIFTRVLEETQADVILIDDLRWTVEMKAVKEMEGHCLRVDRMGIPEVYKTDCDLGFGDDWNHVISNHGGFHDLNKQLCDYAVKIGLLA
jgi:hypothetical protein